MNHKYKITNSLWACQLERHIVKVLNSFDLYISDFIANFTSEMSKFFEEIKL